MHTNSCFPGENLLFKISKMVTGTHGDYILKQIAEKVRTDIKLEKWKKQQVYANLCKFINLMNKQSDEISYDLPPESPLA